jgi:3-oxoadipate enol-lactonase
LNDRLLAHDDAGEGPALVLLHGHPFDRRMWAPQLRSLSAGFRVLAPDLPGYGGAPPRGRTTTMGELADAVLDFIDALDVTRAVVVGLSMGGLVGARTTGTRPRRRPGARRDHRGPGHSDRGRRALRGRAERPDYRALLRGLRVPALVIAGDHDAYADEAAVAELVAALPDPEVVRLPGIGHLPNLEAPADFDEAVRSFATRISA